MKKIKVIVSALLAVLMVLSVVPMFAFASEKKEIEKIAIEGPRPQANVCYIDPYGKKNKDLNFKTKIGSEVKAIETNYYTVTPEGLEDYITYFWGNTRYLLSVKLRVKKGCDIPKDLKKIEVKLNYTNADPITLDSKNYRTEEEFKLEDGTYTISLLNEPRSANTADIELKYVFTIQPQELPEVVIETKKPVDNDIYITPASPDGVAPEYKIKLKQDVGFYAQRDGWLHYDNPERVHFVNQFEAGEKYVLALGMGFSPRYDMYKLPDDLKDVKFKIEFTNDETVRLTDKEYRAPDKFNFETGTYTFKLVEKAGAQPEYQFIYVIEIPAKDKPAETTSQAPTDADTTQAPTQTTAPDTTAEAQKDDNVPNTGAASSGIVTMLALSTVAAGASIIFKKKRK